MGGIRDQKSGIWEYGGGVMDHKSCVRDEWLCIKVGQTTWC